MHIMLVNDDGIHAPGIRALCDAALAAGHRVSVCAPDIERSAASHAITLGRPIPAKRIDYPGAETAYAIGGTPADCACLGLYLLEDVDCVISGVNNGANQGGACLYSGTVAAAMESSQRGVPALASSLCAYGMRNAQDYLAAARVAVRVAEWMMDHPLPRGCCYNLNVPYCAYEAVKGVRAANLAPTYQDAPCYAEVAMEDGAGYTYVYRMDAPKFDDPDADVLVTEAGYASLSKLTWSLQMNAEAPDASGIIL